MDLTVPRFRGMDLRGRIILAACDIFAAFLRDGETTLSMTNSESTELQGDEMRQGRPGELGHRDSRPSCQQAELPAGLRSPPPPDGARFRSMCLLLLTHPRTSAAQVA